MRRAPAPCLEPRCRQFATTDGNGRCEAHKRDPFLFSTRKERLPKDWAHRRNAVFIRDEGKCYICGGEGADAVDHVTPGDDHTLENLKAIHQDVPPYCHRTKTGQDAARAKGYMNSGEYLF